MIPGIASVGLQTIQSLKTSTSRARKSFLILDFCINRPIYDFGIKAVNDVSIIRRHKKALAESLTEMKRKSIKDAKTEDRRVDAIR